MKSQWEPPLSTGYPICFQLPKETQTEPDRAEMLPPPQEAEET